MDAVVKNPHKERLRNPFGFRSLLVEMGRIELPSDVVLPGLLRAQFAADFLCPSHHANKWLIRAQLPKLCDECR